MTASAVTRPAAPGPAPPGDCSFTLADALRLEEVRRGVPQILAGEQHLDRSLRWVHSGDIRDMAAVLKGGELLLTTGMGIDDSAQRQRRYVADLWRRGIAGLVLELGSAYATAPRALVEEARARELPLIVLHRQVAFVEITEAVHRAIVRGQTTLRERGERLQQRLTDLVVSGAGVAEVARALSKSVANPVVISHDGELVYSAADHTSRAAVGSAWEAVERRLEHAPEHLSAPLHVDGDPDWGRVRILALERRLSSFDELALKQALAPLALAFVRAHEVEVLAARERGEFLDALADPTVEMSERYAMTRASELGFTQRPPWLLPIGADRALGSPRLDERAWALLSRSIRSELRSRRTQAVAGTVSRPGHLAVVVGISGDEHQNQYADQMADLIRRAARRAGVEDMVVCIGRPGDSWTAVRAGLTETAAALPAMRHAPSQPWFDVGVPALRQLVWALRHDRLFGDFVARRLSPIEAHDAQRQGDLRHTLEVFCAHGGRKADAARALHLERQSLYKRLARVQQLLGVDLDDEDARLSLHLALRARRMLDDGVAGVGGGD